MEERRVDCRVEVAAAQGIGDDSIPGRWLVGLKTNISTHNHILTLHMVQPSALVKKTTSI